MRALQCHACASRRFLDWYHCRTCVRTSLSMLSDSRNPTGRVFRSASRAPRRRLQRKREARTETANSPRVRVACIGYHEAAACHSRHVPLTEGRPLANAANHLPRKRAPCPHACRPASGSEPVPSLAWRVCRHRKRRERGQRSKLAASFRRQCHREAIRYPRVLRCALHRRQQGTAWILRR